VHRQASLADIRQVSSTRPDGRSGYFRALGTSSRGNAGRTLSMKVIGGNEKARFGYFTGPMWSIGINDQWRLARYFSTAPEFWMNLWIQYDLRGFEDSEEAAEIARAVQPRKGAAA